MCFFNHKWVIVDVQHFDGERLDKDIFQQSFYKVKVYDRIRETRILYKCIKCGINKEVTIDGIWEKSQLL